MARNPGSWAGIDLCDGRYCSLEKLGEGGMGYVYKARDKRMGRFVVIKVPRAEMLVDSQFRKRFVRELQSLVKLEHRHIVAIQDYNQEDKIPYAVMQYLPQGDLDDRRSQDPQDLKSWLKDIARALDFVHKKGYVHRDVKPGNILFDDEGYAYLSDFGIAKVVADSEEDQQGLTKMGFVIGTPEYMAPELHSNKFDGRIDQYALAVTVYELLSGGTPYRGTTPVEIMFAHKTEQAARIPNISAEFNDAILKGMAKDPDQRYASCAKFAEAVLAAMDNKVQSPRQTEPTAVPIIKNVDQSKTRVESPRRSTQVRSSDSATGRQQLQQDRKLRKKRKERTIWIAAATGFVLLTLIVLILVSGSEEPATARKNDSDSRNIAANVAEQVAREREKSERRAKEALGAFNKQRRAQEEYLQSLGLVKEKNGWHIQAEPKLNALNKPFAKLITEYKSKTRYLKTMENLLKKPRLQNAKNQLQGDREAIEEIVDDIANLDEQARSLLRSIEKTEEQLAKEKRNFDSALQSSGLSFQEPNTTNVENLLRKVKEILDDVASAEEPASAEEGGETEAEETPQEPAASFAELKDQLTALEKKTKLSLGGFNKWAKEYIKQKKDLVKKIKAVEGIIAQRSKYQDSLPDGEQKTKFGQETDEKYMKPLAKGKSQLQGLSQPDTWLIEGKLKRAEKLLKQIEGTPEYQEKPGPIDSLAEKIAKYRKGLNVQQARMAK